MKQLLTVVTAILMSTCCFASGSGFNKNSPTLNALGSAWKKAQRASQPAQSPHDITMSYGGEDLDHHQSLA